MTIRWQHARAMASAGILLAIGGLGAARPAAAQLFQVVTTSELPGAASQTSGLAVIDPDHLLTVPVSLPAQLISLARNPRTGELFTLTLAGLTRLDFATGALTPVGSPYTIGIRSIAFDSQGNLFGFALCDPTYPNELFQLDPATGAVTGVLGSLDSGRVAPCSPSSLTQGAAIAIDPADDTLYLVAMAASNITFVDRFDLFLVPTAVASSSFIGGLPFPPVAATISDRKLWFSFAFSILGPGLGLGTVDLSDPSPELQFSSGGAYSALTFPGNAFIVGLAAASVACAPSATATCLFSRFKVEATYDARPANGTGPANVLLESGESVKFSFFDPGNVELLVKVLNACTPPFNKWWVAGGGLTDVGVAIKVTDTRTGAVKNYNSAKGKLFQTFFDTSAFACP